MNTNLKCTCKLAERLRSFVPLPGSEFQKFMLVELEPGEQIPEHQHPEHTVLFYPNDCAPIEFRPGAGTVIYLPPGTVHRVPKVVDKRVSFAMVVDNG